MYEIQAVIWYGSLAGFAVLVCYACSRAASIAFFRTKLEYFKAMMREGAGHNGTED